MKAVRIASVVEGDGEVSAVPVLLRRLIAAIDETATAVVPQGFRHPSGSIVKAGGIELP